MFIESKTDKDIKLQVSMMLDEAMIELDLIKKAILNNNLSILLTIKDTYFKKKIEEIDDMVKDLKDINFKNSSRLKIRDINEDFLKLYHKDIKRENASLFELARNVENQKLSFIKKDDSKIPSKELNVVVFLTGVVDEENDDLPEFAYGFRFTNEKNETFLEMIVDGVCEGGLHSFVANERRRTALQATISIAEYYLYKHDRRSELKVNKRLESAFPIFGLEQIDDYEVKMTKWKEGLENLINKESERLETANKLLAETSSTDNSAILKRRELAQDTALVLTKKINKMKRWLEDYEKINFIETKKEGD